MLVPLHPTEPLPISEYRAFSRSGPERHTGWACRLGDGVAGAVRLRWEFPKHTQSAELKPRWRDKNLIVGTRCHEVGECSYAAVDVIQ